MNAKSFIKEGLATRDRENVFELQFTLLLYLEEQAPLPKWLAEKIEKRAEETGLRKGEIIASAASNILAATTLAKKANRQTLAEKLQIEYLRDIRGISVNKLPTNGEGSIRLRAGNFVYDSNKAYMGATKTIDATFTQDFIAFKYVNEAGGAQDNQISDVKDFLINAIRYTQKHDNLYTFSAIVDGKYIESKINELKVHTNKRVRVFTSDTYTTGRYMFA